LTTDIVRVLSFQEAFRIGSGLNLSIVRRYIGVKKRLSTIVRRGSGDARDVRQNS